MVVPVRSQKIRPSEIYQGTLDAFRGLGYATAEWWCADDSEQVKLISMTEHCDH